ncbi:hypothetical protein HPP92_003780 [Vanilla planifolia]|uniref:Uncharacterized protein n=1 Tax=Vanilla planifolia TaxID=51239 RepID=A0A835VNV1_VANPL|nr:hypothetical protein HPP92_004203 [Vanilla planifolia]KAG0503708.1 hypothetical protein HPP92_003780 [Vanilla planifolia]
MRLMLRDAILRLREAGYGILALAIRVKFPELATLQNITVFGLDDLSIFAGGHGYLTDVRFHVVPNHFLMHSDLMSLPQGNVLPSLVPGQRLVVTQLRAGPFSSGVRINHVPIKVPNVIYNAKIVVHGIYLPFPHLYLDDLASADHISIGESGTCGTSSAVSPDECLVTPASAPAMPAIVDLDDGMY